MKVLYVSSEVAPFAKTGGLADVAGSLPIALEEEGVDVRVAMPRFASVKCEKDEAVIGKSVKVYFIRNDDYFNRKELYGDKFGDYADNLDRFAFFCRQVLERCKLENFKPDVIHCNDWQTALIPVYLNTIYKYDPFFNGKGVKVLFTIHNMAYQGLFDKEEFPKTGLDWYLFDIKYFEFYGKVNLMKAGLIYADAVSTVSPTYAREIVGPDLGCGLEGVLKSRPDTVTGILNGIDYDIWNPATDKKIYKRYSLTTIVDRYANKEKLQKELGFKMDRDIPMIGMISRLADQKGLDLLARIVHDILDIKVQFVLLGTGDNKYHILLEKASKAHPKNSSVNLKFDAVLAEKIYASSDIFLIPSRYEPCGLSQMIWFKYGVVAVVRQTGGLKDSVIEYDQKTRAGTGFTFTDYKPEAFLGAVKRALFTYTNKTAWRDLVKRIMSLDFSWRVSAGEYVRLYDRMISK